MNRPLPKTDHLALHMALDDMKTILEEHKRYKEALQILANPIPPKLAPHEIASHALKGWPVPTDNLKAPQTTPERVLGTRWTEPTCPTCKSPQTYINAGPDSHWECSRCNKESQNLDDDDVSEVISVNELVSRLLTTRSYLKISDTEYLGQHGDTGRVRIHYVHRDKTPSFVVGENFTDAVQKLVQKLKG